MSTMSITPYKFSFENFVLHPTKCTSNEFLQKVCLVASFVFNILTLGLVHQAYSLKESNVVQLPSQDVEEKKNLTDSTPEVLEKKLEETEVVAKPAVEAEVVVNPTEEIQRKFTTTLQA